MKKYALQQQVTENQLLHDLSISAEGHGTSLYWKWPRDPEIKFALIFDCSNEEPVLENLLAKGYTFSTAVRSLTSSFEIPFSNLKNRYLICPAAFAEDNSIAVYPAPLITDWIYRKTEVKIVVDCKHLLFSTYQKVSISLELVEPSQACLLAQTLKYEIAGLGQYPVDENFIQTGGYIYIQKSQEVRFFLEEENAHLFDLLEQRSR